MADLTNLTERQSKLVKNFKQFLIERREKDLENAINADVMVNENHYDGKQIAIAMAGMQYQWKIEHAKDRLKYIQNMSLDELYKALKESL